MRGQNAGSRTLLVLAGATLIAVVIVVIASTSGPSGSERINRAVAQTRSEFHDRLLVGASASGSTLVVRLSITPHGPSLVRGTFEARLLAHTLANRTRTDEQDAIQSVRYVDTGGNPLWNTGNQSDPVGTTAKVPRLAAGACNSAARRAVKGRDLKIRSVLALPAFQGTCIVDFRTSDPVAFAKNAQFVVGALSQAMGDGGDRPFLVQVDDEKGEPEFASSWVPGNLGQTWIKPGLSRAYVFRP